MPTWIRPTSFGGLNGGLSLNLESYGVSKHPGGDPKVGTTRGCPLAFTRAYGMTATPA